MMKLLPLAGTAWLERQLALVRDYVPPPSSAPIYDEKAILIHQPFFKTNRYLTEEWHVLEKALSVNTYMKWAALEATNGSDETKVRSIYRSVVETWLPIVEEMDFSSRSFEGGWCSRKAAQELVEHHSGEILETEGQYARCRWIMVPRPYGIYINKVLECAALSGDANLARRIARAYPFPESSKLTARFEIREAILRHLLADEDDFAKQLANRLDHGYTADDPPHRIEFPLGLVNNDEDQLRNGIKVIDTRFKGIWSESKCRKAHSRWLAKPGSPVFLRKDPTWDEFADWMRSYLVAGEWILSTWALAFLNIAAWRGMTSLFDASESSSQFCPIRLAKPL